MGQIGYHLTALALCFIAAGCAVRGGRPAGGPSDQSVLTAEQLQASNEGNLLDAIRVLRPQWLDGRTIAARRNPEATIIVYLDDHRMGPASMLRQMSIASAGSMRFYSPSEAVGRFGPDGANGIIAVESP